MPESEPLSILLCVQEACDIHQYQIITNNTSTKQRTISADECAVTTHFSQNKCLLEETSHARKNESSPSPWNSLDGTLKYEQIIDNITT